MDDQRDVVDVDPPGRDVSGDKHPGAAVGERGEVALAGALPEVAVQFDGGHTRRGELLGELLGGVLGAHEQHGALLAAGQLHHDSRLISGTDGEDVVGHRRDRRDSRVDGVCRRRREVALDDDIDAVVQGGAEQHSLAHLGCPVQQPLDGGQETQVGHVVGLVQDGDLDPGQVAEPLADQVLQAAWARDEDVHAWGEGLNLRALPDAAEHHGRRESGRAGQRLYDGEDLVGELPRRDQHQGAGLARAPRSTGEAHHEREAEGECLAAAGAAAPEDVLAGQRVGQGRDLDRERAGDAVGGEAGHEGCGDAEVSEGGWGAHAEQGPVGSGGR